MVVGEEAGVSGDEDDVVGGWGWGGRGRRRGRGDVDEGGGDVGGWGRV